MAAATLAAWTCAWQALRLLRRLSRLMDHLAMLGASKGGAGRSGSARPRHDLLTRLGWAILQVRCFEWSALRSAEAKQRHLAPLLEGQAHRPPEDAWQRRKPS